MSLLVSVQAAEEFVPTVSWLATVFDTLLSISSSSYKPTGPLLHWFPHVGHRPPLEDSFNRLSLN